MKLEDIESKQQRLMNLLKDMAAEIKRKDELERVFCELKQIYSGGFRHRYADFFPFVVNLDKEKSDFDSLTTNLIALQELSQEKLVNGEEDIECVSNAIFKLCDHINLEIARYYPYVNDNNKDKGLSDLKESVDTSLKNLNNARDELNKVNGQLTTIQTELIAVLSIFAAIVLTFSGGISFISSALSSIKESPFYKTVFFVLLCGFVVFNTIFLMMYMVGKITGRSIYATFKNEDCATCLNKNNKLKCSGITRVRKRLPYIFWLNVVFILLMIADIILWIHFPWLEYTLFCR